MMQMKEFAIVGSDMPSNVYVILRVFNVKIDGEIGVRAYLDPWWKAQEGRLKFDIQYKVTVRGH
jgi:hypothetical protein